LCRTIKTIRNQCVIDPHLSGLLSLSLSLSVSLSRTISLSGFILISLNLHRPQPSISLGNSVGSVGGYPGTITMAKTTTVAPSPRLTTDCSSNSASPEPAIAVIQSVYGVKAELGGGGGGALELPSIPTNGDEGVDMYAEYEDEHKSDYSSDHESRGAVIAN